LVLKCAQACLVELRKVVKELEPPAADLLLHDFQGCSFLGRVVPLTVSFLFFMSAQGDLLPQLASELVSLVQAIAKLTPYSEEVASAETHCLELSKEFPAFMGSKTVGTRHPYRGGLTQSKEASIPGARYLLLKFDPRCELAFSSDHLKLYSSREMEIEIGNPIEYSCPQETMFVPGDSIFFHLGPKNPIYTYSSETAWGYECRG